MGDESSKRRHISGWLEPKSDSDKNQRVICASPAPVQNRKGHFMETNDVQKSPILTFIYEVELGRLPSNSFAALPLQMRALNISQNGRLSEIGAQMVFNTLFKQCLWTK